MKKQLIKSALLLNFGFLIIGWLLMKGISEKKMEVYNQAKTNFYYIITIDGEYNSAIDYDFWSGCYIMKDSSRIKKNIVEQEVNKYK